LGSFQVNSSTWEEFPNQDWLYHTNLAGGFPAGFFSGGNLGVRAQPAKHLTVTNCVDAFSNPIFVGHPAGAPPYSYWQSSPKLNRATLGTAGVPGQTPTIWGKLRKLTIDVQVASTTTGLTFSCPPSNQSVANNTNNTITSFGTCNIDLTTPGKRVIQLSGNTGIQGSDSVPTLAYEPWIPDNLSFFASATPGGGDPLSVFVEIVTDQGGADVSPFSLSASTGAYVRFGVAAGFLLHSSNTPLAIGAGAYGLSGVPAGLSRSAPAGPPQVHFRHKRV
jgi:hypothetical protein